MPKNNRHIRISHCHLQGKTLDPYQLLKAKSERLSWNRLSDVEIYADKQAVIEWFAMLRDYSETTVKAIVVEGILDSQFHKITFILTLVQSVDFEEVTSKDAYQQLYDFVCKTPAGIRDWIDDIDFKMSMDVLALLSRNR
ncbi:MULTISPECIES: hypothetical protein [Shewanella]|jgi:hypothetical protein|uniref:Uncharacterized protein n=1 Tax=Shewanella oncorhynchi TaxID=2726434 RepID=A0ABX1KSH9_9GAMM|nr:MULTISPECIES: hypothetical protein [Shewanella]AEG13350.1 hypothetical protein Sbal175_4130 [Shewanella baltica BA175]AEH12014.1 hypothetical protein Sbal117_0211 [Shewanella baltica OS117]EHQ13105.1 hypothetical protein Sbal183_0163 [Shewanella baltica OS183]MCS6235360.1 hypothetical protein [Shewanella baltica]MCS6259460.1 hypothetical protein [Shewanella baltica]